MTPPPPLPLSTRRFEDAPRLPQDPRHIGDGAQDQGADHHVHRAVRHLLQVLPGQDQERLVGQVLIGGHAPAQVPLEVRVRVGAGHRAAVRVEGEVGPAAAADLQQAQRVVLLVGELVHVAEKLSLYRVHLLVVRKCDIIGEEWKHALVHTAQAQQLHYPQRHHYANDFA